MSSYAMNHISDNANHHSGATDADETEYDRLRALASEEGQKRARCFERSRAAYESGDGAGAHYLSEEGKRHGVAMERYNGQARDHIFRANNAHQPADTIDLHGLHVEEVEEVLEKRIAAATARGEGYLRVIVGKGNHSAGGVRKVEPTVEEFCRRRGLRVEEDAEGNSGRILVRLGQGGGSVPHSGGYHAEAPGQQGYGRYGEQQQQPPNELEGLAKKAAPKIIKKLQGCCIIC